MKIKLSAVKWFKPQKIVDWFMHLPTKMDHRHWLIFGGSVIGVILLAAVATTFIPGDDGLSLPASALREQARDLASRQKYDSAEAIYKGLTLTNGKDVTLWREAAFVYQLDRERPQAINAYEKISQLDPKDAMTFNILGNLYRDEKQFDKAEAAYKTALSLNPNLEIAKINLAHLQKLQGK